MSEFVETNTPASNATPERDALQVRESGDRTEAELLDALKRNTEFLQDHERPLPVEQDQDPAPEDIPQDVDDQDIPVQDEDMDADIDDGTEGEDGTPTQEPDVYTLDDLDDIQITHKINGEDVTKPLSEWIKNSATNEALDGKGRELGDARKALEEERVHKLGEIDRVMEAAAHVLGQAEEKHAAEYHSLDKQIEQAREEGDTHLVHDLKDQREQVQNKYWKARNEREQMIKTAQDQKAEIENNNWNQKLHVFSENIHKAIPDWSEEVAGEIRQFALDRGIPEHFVNQMVDVDIIKFVDDYRRSELGRAKGAKKREAAPVRHTPVRKVSPEAKRTEEQIANRDRVLSGQASLDEENAFLRGIAQRHFN